MMRLRKGMVADYLGYITSTSLVDPGDVTEDMSVYDESISAMAANARYDGNLEKLRLAIDALVSKPDGRLGQFRNFGYPFTEDQLAAILRYAYASIWPDAHMSGPGEAAPIELVEATEEEWAAQGN